MFSKAPSWLAYLWFVLGFVFIYFCIVGFAFTPMPWVAFGIMCLYSLIFSAKTSKENFGDNSRWLFNILSQWDGNRVFRGQTPKWVDWYHGGNSKYNPAYPWTQDCWHFMNDSLAWCIALSLVVGFGDIRFGLWYMADSVIFHYTKSGFFKRGYIDWKTFWNDTKLIFVAENLHKTDDGSGDVQR